MVMDLSDLGKKKTQWDNISLTTMEGQNFKFKIDPENPASGAIILIADLYKRIADLKNTMLEMKKYDN